MKTYQLCLISQTHMTPCIDSNSATVSDNESLFSDSNVHNKDAILLPKQKFHGSLLELQMRDYTYLKPTKTILLR